jgi:hypothetical protein
MFDWLRDRSYIVPPILCLAVVCGAVYIVSARSSGSISDSDAASPAHAAAAAPSAASRRPAALHPQPRRKAAASKQRSRHRLARRTRHEALRVSLASFDLPAPANYADQAAPAQAAAQPPREGIISIYHYGGDPDPRDAVVEFVTAMQATDAEGMKSLMSSGKMGSRMDQILKKLYAQYPQLKEIARVIVDKLEINVGESTVDGDKAVVPITVSVKGQQGQNAANIDVVWADGKWKISDENAMQIGMAIRSVVMPMLMKTQVGKQIMNDLISGKLDLP